MSDEVETMNSVEEQSEKKQIKTLANCSGLEFLKQTNKIRKEVQIFLEDTKILDLRKRKPVVKVIPKNATPEEKEAIEAENNKAMRKQAMQNISDMLDMCLEKNPEKTMDLLGLLCFMNHDEVMQMTGSELLLVWGELLHDEGVISFFTSLTKWEVMLTSD